jgi:hypothetical protein
VTPHPSQQFDDRPPEFRKKVLWSSGEMTAPSLFPVDTSQGDILPQSRKNCRAAFLPFGL